MAWNTTTLIITIAVGSTAVTVSFVLAVWLLCRRRKRLAPPSSQVQYSKLQKRRGQSPSAKAKHVSLTTTASSSRKSSTSLTIPEISQPIYEGKLENYQQQCQTEYLPHPSNVQRNPSATSNYSFRPEHVSKGISTCSPTLTVPQPLFSRKPVGSNLTSRPQIPDRCASVSDLNRAPSARVPNYHTDSEYSALIGEDLVELLGGGLPPPGIPRKSSRRGSAPEREAAVISEELQGWESAPMLESAGSPDNPRPVANGRFRTSWYANGK